MEEILSAEDGSVSWEEERIKINANFQETLTLFENVTRKLAGYVTVSVGTGGDYPTIGAAITALCATYQGVQFSTTVTPFATIRLLSGFVMAEQVFVKNIDLGWIRISSVDSVVTLDRAALIEPISGFPFSAYPAFFADNAVLPQMGCAFKANTGGSAISRYAAILYGPSAILRFLYSGLIDRGFSGGDTVNEMSGVYMLGGAQLYGSLPNLYIRNFYNNIVCVSSRVDLNLSAITGSSNGSILLQQGSIANLEGCTWATSGVGLSVAGGSTANAKGSSGSLSQTANVPTADGIIYK